MGLLFFSALVSMLASALFASPAVADEPGETTEGYVLVQQVLGHLAHDSSEEGVMVAMEKIDDALTTDNQEGVDVAQLEQAQAVLASGDVPGAQALLQSSIAQAVSEIEPAVGEDTGTTEVLNPLPGREGLTGEAWFLLVLSVLLLLIGLALSWKFRPQDTVQELRQRLGEARPASAELSPETTEGSA